MNRRVLFAVPLAVLVACSGTETTAPSVQQPPVSLDIFDGAHTLGNKDFFFLPPVVLPTGPLTNWTRGGFNRNLSPRVEICPLNAASAAAVGATTPCKTMAGFPVIISGSAVKKHFPPASDPTDVLSGLPDDWAHYHAQWKVPNPCNIVYRITVKVGDVKLGHADVVCVTSILGLFTIDYRKFGPALRGLNLQIPFRIEQWALCAVPGVGPCSSAEVNLNVAAATISLPPNPGDPAGSQPSGVTLPLQTVPGPAVITVQDCPDLHTSGVTDLPTFGRCIRITSNPALPPLAILATVFVCNLGIALPPHISHLQSERITLHRFDVGAPQPLAALPHAAGCPQFEPPASSGSIKGVLQELAQGHLASAGGQVLGMFAPKPLYARRLNLGAGGKTCCFSDFEFVLPAYMTIESGDGQVALPGSTLPNDPTVRVRDLGGENVAGARVTFTPTGDGTATPVSMETAGDGLASTAWKLKATPGINYLVASGLGIAGADHNGPRCGLDPFQAIQSGPFFPSEFGPGAPPCGPGENGPAETAVTVLTGSQTFTANGAAAVVFHELYGSAYTGSTGPASLYSIDPGTGNATLIGPIGFNRVGAMDFHPTTNVLYATGQRSSDNTPVLITINPTTGAGTEVGPTGALGSISDVAFRDDGTLFAYDANPPDHRLYTINIGTGAATPVGTPPDDLQLHNNSGNGMVFDWGGVLHHSNASFAYTLDQTTGVATEGAAMSFPPECPSGGRIAASDRDDVGVQFFGALNCGTTSYLTTVNYFSGVVTLIGATVADLDGLTLGPDGCTSCSSPSFSMARSSIKASDLLVGRGASRSASPALSNPQVSPKKKVAKRPAQ